MGKETLKVLYKVAAVLVADQEDVRNLCQVSHGKVSENKILCPSEISKLSFLVGYSRGHPDLCLSIL